MPKYKTITIEPTERGVILWLNRPKIKNAISELVINELRDFFKNPSTNFRYIIIAGKGDCFAAGADLKEMYNVTEEKAYSISRYLHQLLKSIGQYPVPVVSAVHGYAIGGGFELAMAADFIFATSTCFFSLPELNYDLIPGGGATQRLPQKMGRADALYYIMSGEPISADSAKAYGIVQKLMDEKNFISDVVSHMELLIGTKDEEAIATAKSAIRNAGNDNGYEIESKGFAKLLTQKAKVHIEKFMKKSK
ncbi:MAG: hypothetical protein C0599_05280 [Salinivirgaceae bacterium]|nr:MAG: hypothetical protein C0599_05280 [Salinivirgaceae bacterium]